MRARVLAGVLAVGVALPGCSGDDGDAAPTLAPVTASASASATASATAAAAEDVPEEARAATAEGAAAFVRFFYDEIGASYATRDPDRLRRLVTPECASCERIISAITRLRDEDATVEGYRLTVRDVAVPSISPGQAVAQATAYVDSTEFVRRDADGNETSRSPAKSAVVQEIGLAYVRDEGWSVSSVATG